MDRDPDSASLMRIWIRIQGVNINADQDSDQDSDLKYRKELRTISTNLLTIPQCFRSGSAWIPIKVDTLDPDPDLH